MSLSGVGRGKDWWSFLFFRLALPPLWVLFVVLLLHFLCNIMCILIHYCILLTCYFLSKLFKVLVCSSSNYNHCYYSKPVIHIINMVYSHHYSFPFYFEFWSIKLLLFLWFTLSSYFFVLSFLFNPIFILKYFNTKKHIL